MELQLHTPIEWPGGGFVFRVNSVSSGRATLSHVGRTSDGLPDERNKIEKQLQIPSEVSLRLPPGQLTLDATDAMGRRIEVTASIESIPKADPLPTLESRIAKLETDIEDIKQDRD